MIPNTDVLEKANLSSVVTMIRKAQMRWAGHVSRMTDSRILKQLFYGQLKNGRRKVGASRKRYKDSLKAHLKDFNLDVFTWEKAASDRPAWRKTIHNGALFSKEKKLNAAKEKRMRRKAGRGPPNRLSTHRCQTCFLTPIALFSHLQTHK